MLASRRTAVSIELDTLYVGCFTGRLDFSTLISVISRVDARELFNRLGVEGSRSLLTELGSRVSSSIKGILGIGLNVALPASLAD